MKTAALYGRQSKGYASVAQQLELGARRAAERGWKVVGRFHDKSISASSGEPRPGYDAMMDLIRSGGADAIVVRHYDRLYRQPMELEGLIDSTEGVHIESVYGGGYDLGTADGRTQARVIGAFARGEVEKKAERQRDGARRDAEAGKPRKGCPEPFGWLPDRVTMHPAEQAAVADACGSLLAGGTISGIVRNWTARGVKPHQGEQWTRSSVLAILRSARIAGISTYRGEEVGPGSWEALVEPETYRAVVRLLDDHGRRRAPGVRSMLGGWVRCQCGNICTGSLNQLGQGAYRCDISQRNGRPGPHVAMRREGVDDYVGRLVVARMSMDDAVDLVAPKRQADTGPLRDEEAAIRSKLKSLGPALMMGQLDEKDVRSAREYGETRLAQIADELAELGRESVLAPLLARPQEAWDALSTDRRRAVVVELFDSITLYSPGRGARGFDPDKVLPEDREAVRWKEAA